MTLATFFSEFADKHINVISKMINFMVVYKLFMLTKKSSDPRTDP